MSTRCVPGPRGTARPVAAVFALAAAVALSAPVASGAGAVAAPAAPQGASTLSAEEIVAKYVAARGGLKKIRSVQSLRESGRMTTGANRQAVVVRELKRPFKSRIEITSQGTTAVVASNGTKGWRMSPFEGDTAPVVLPAEAVQEAIEQADIEGPLVDWKAKGHRIELAGRETVGTHDAFKIKMTLKSGGTRYEYIDAKTFDRVRADSTRTLKGVPTRVTMTFDGYKKTAGLAFPRTVTVDIEGRPQTMRVMVDKVEVNPAIPDDRFEQAPGASN
ncbi:MAG TPA: hypothetical protein VJV75_12505 [Candidatus Polarisedimenticolia bacterium]|nr:hypothetical protein [Candidatus Polarisedimenticolia bacterium]